MDKNFVKRYKNVKYEALNLLNKYQKSEIIQNHIINIIESLLYGTLINNFFNDLNSKTIKDLNLPKGYIGRIKKSCVEVLKEIKLAKSQKSNKINKEYYKKFKKKIKEHFPKFIALVHQEEKKFGFKNVDKYLKTIRVEIRNSGTSHNSYSSFLITRALE